MLKMVGAMPEHFLPGAQTELVWDGDVAQLWLKRPEKANAFSLELIRELTQTFKELLARAVRALVLRADGKHFSAGADLAWMQAAAKLSAEENAAQAKELQDMLQALADLPFPTIAIVQGSCYGGALGLVACCDSVFVQPSAKFCLSEVRLGLLPAIILPFLLARMQPGFVKRMALTAQPFGAGAAIASGLADVIIEQASDIDDELAFYTQGGPQAQKAFKKLFSSKKTAEECVQAIATARSGPEAQAGLAAFFAKKPASWQQKDSV